MATAAANRSKTTKPSKSAARADERRASGTDAIEMLKDDHERVDALFKRYEKGKDAMSADERKALAREICAELDVHTTLEEEIFYPAARAALDDDGHELLDEAEVEHESAKDLIEWLEGASPEEPLYDAKVTVLGEFVKHHVEEEHEELFPACKASDMDLEAIGEAMRARKEELVGAA